MPVSCLLFASVLTMTVSNYFRTPIFVDLLQKAESNYSRLLDEMVSAVVAVVTAS